MGNSTGRGTSFTGLSRVTDVGGEGGEQFFKVPYQCCAGSRHQTPTIGAESQRTRVKIKAADGQHLSPVCNRPQRDRVILDAIRGGKHPPVWTEYDCINGGGAPPSLIPFIIRRGLPVGTSQS